MLQQVGYCPGVENYSRHLDGRPPGSMPFTLLDYFPDDDWVLFIDESHVTIPQLHAMYHGDQHRKRILVEHGFRLPSALDNRPLRFEEIEARWPQVVFISATPGPYELEHCQGEVVEQIIRPTGLVDPAIHVRPAANQVIDAADAARQRADAGERTLITTLTKKLAEDLASYLADQHLRCRYMHSEIETLDRVAILRDLREGDYDVLVGVNLLREGLDLPEVSLVAIMDADKTGFLRSATSLIQQIGRAARNVNATVLLYADQVTPAMQQAIDETNRRRNLQLQYNRDHNITPQTIRKAIRRGIDLELQAHRTARSAVGLAGDADQTTYDRSQVITELNKQMLQAAQDLEFERAAHLRDRIKALSNTPDNSVDPHDPLPREKTSKPGTPGTRPRPPKKHAKNRR